MSEGNLVDKVVENKLLLMVQRVGVFVFTILAPIFIGFLIGLDGSVKGLDRRVLEMETRMSVTDPQRDNQYDELRKQVIELQSKIDAQNDKLVTQNTAILQAIARLEAKSDAR